MPRPDALMNHITLTWPQLTWAQRLESLRAENEVVFSSSLGNEDQLITHHLAKEKLPVRIFTLDTGRLFLETLDLLERTENEYDISIARYYPSPVAVEGYVNAHGMDGFYDSIENRKSCCFIRKVEPLSRALQGASIWISGLRRAQSPHRAGLPFAEWDAAHQVLKLYPLLDMSDEVLWKHIHDQRIPYNPLFDQGFTSIGCAPCTRAIQPGEDTRAGRWWWEQEGKSECGLHRVDGKLVPVSGENLDAR